MSRKVVLALLLCVFSAIAICGGYLYLRTNNLESRMDFLEKTTEEPPWESSDLSNLSSSSIEIVGLPTWYTPYNFYCQEVRLTVKNNWTSVISIVGVLVNGTFVDLSKDRFDETNVPILLFPRAEITLNVTHPNGGFISGAKYQFSVVALIGASSRNSLYEATFPAPELKIEHLRFENTAAGKYVNVTLANIAKTSVTINEIWINNAYNWSISKTIAIGEHETIGVQYNWIVGYSYQVKVVTSEGNEYLYTATAPT